MEVCIQGTGGHCNRGIFLLQDFCCLPISETFHTASWNPSLMFGSVTGIVVLQRSHLYWKDVLEIPNKADHNQWSEEHLHLFWLNSHSIALHGVKVHMKGYMVCMRYTVCPGYFIFLELCNLHTAKDVIVSCNWYVTKTDTWSHLANGSDDSIHDSTFD